MSSEKRLSILKTIIALAWADGTFEEREVKLLGELIQTFQTDSDEKAELARAVRGRDKDITLAGALTEYEERLYCYQQAAKMSYADGVVVEQERLMLSSLRDALGVSARDAAAAESAAREIMSTQNDEPDNP